MFFDRLEDCVNIHLGAQLEFGLGNAIRWVSGFELTHCLTALGKQREEQCNTHESITPVVQCRIDDSTIALTTNDSASATHLGGNIHLAHSRCRVGATMTLGHISQGTRRREVAHRGTRSVRKHIVGNRYQRVFLDKEFTILHHNSQTINIGVYNKTHISPTLTHKLADACQVLGDGLGRVTKVASWVTIEFLDLLHTQGLKQLGDGDTAYRVDCIDGNGKTGLANRIDID